MNENKLSRVIIGAAIEVHKELGGPGLLEDVYEEALCHELQLRGLAVRRQLGLRIQYKGKQLRKRLVLDVLVNDLVIVEVKSVALYNDVFEAQVLTYLRLTKKRLGIVIISARNTFAKACIASSMNSSDSLRLSALAPLR
jgi:GxxExxY protein